jgi:hypothetical protein
MLPPKIISKIILLTTLNFLAALSLEPEFAVYPCPAPQGKAPLAFTLPAGGRLSLALVAPLGRKRTLLPLAYHPPGKNGLPIPLPQKGLWLLLVEPAPPKTLKFGRNNFLRPQKDFGGFLV